MNGKRGESKPTAMVMGVTGMAGLDIAKALKSPDAPGGPWIVYGVARRAKPTWFPSSVVDRYIAVDAVDVTDTKEKLSPLSSHVTHVFWAALYVGPCEEDNIAVNSAMLSNVLDVLTAHSNRIFHITLQTGSGHYMGRVHDKTRSWAQLEPQEAPFREDVSRLPNQNFYYVQEDIVKSYGPKLTYSIHRAATIIGASTRSVYNLLLTAAVYAAICKRLDVTFRYPGTSWKTMWKVFCEEFRVDFVPLDGDECGFDLTAEMKDKGYVWDKIVEEKGLVKTSMEEITHFGFLQNLTNLHFQLVSDMNKSKEFGFFGHVDSLKSVRFWVAKLREMNIIP